MSANREMLRQNDPRVFDAIVGEEQRQKHGIELIPSENYTYPEVLAANGLTPLLCDRDTPTPVISHAIRARKAAAGINLTASHNPAEWQGLKFSLANGAPATMEATRAVEKNIARRFVAGD